MEVHQLLSNLDPGDAISNDAIEIREVLRSNGFESNIYARYIHPDVARECSFYKEHKKRSSPENIVIFHHSIGSEVSEYVRNVPDRKVMIYHNITPSWFFEAFDPRFAYLMKKGRQELKEFADVPDLALGDSPYNASELRELGYKRVDVLPIIVNTRHLDTEPDRKTMERYSDGLTNILFVGRVAPNKRFEDIIKTFCFYQRHINRASRLILAGSYKNLENYHASLVELAGRLGLENVVFTGFVTQAELNACYRLSHAFLSMSEHEGFCVPLLEAMHFAVPVFAYSASAVPETMGNSGVVFKEKRYEEVAEIMDIVLKDPTLREGIIAEQKRRLRDFDSEKVGRMLMSHIEAVRRS